ncbi:MAG: hypothetical protein ACREU6_08420 [Steroidobacteraceae bacterium]
MQLFVERALSGLESFELTDENALAVADICRRLDGIPLAIELVAARVGFFGLDALASGLDDGVLLVAKGRRTASARHQSLRATLAWSYRLLSPVEQAIFRRLSAFRGWFSVESAVAVVCGGVVAAEQALEGVMSLAGKSLLATDIGGPGIRYRLLHITRAYASERLDESEDGPATLRRHGMGDADAVAMANALREHDRRSACRIGQGVRAGRRR